MDYESLYKSYLAEFTAADAGVGGDGELEYSSDDTYAPGDSRVPKALGATITRKGKAKKKKKKVNEDTIYDYLLFPPDGEEQEKIVNFISTLKSSDDEVYRGMSSAEYKTLIKKGSVVSRGAGNTRKGISGSYVSDSVQLAGRFAFAEYKDKGRAYLVAFDKDKLPELNPADEGNYWTSNLLKDAIKASYYLPDMTK